jgi:signal transduction histidine kinase
MVTMAEVVDEVLALVQRDLRASGIALELKIEDPQADLEADKVQLQQVLLNLIRNAIEAMENTEADRRRLCIERRVHDQLVEVAVRDSGHGIAADNADNLFKAFYSTKAEGMGMGLAICRSIIESHGGRIWATPNPDQGSTFTFTLPIATEDGENGTETSRIPGRR